MSCTCINLGHIIISKSIVECWPFLLMVISISFSKGFDEKLSTHLSTTYMYTATAACGNCGRWVDNGAGGVRYYLVYL